VVALLTLRQGDRPKRYSNPCSWRVAGRHRPLSQFNLPLFAEHTSEPTETTALWHAHNVTDGELYIRLPAELSRGIQFHLYLC
jgi:hypothetical protein